MTTDTIPEDFVRVDRAAVTAAWQTIRPHVRRTPVMDVAAADLGLAGQPLNFKLEFMQYSGTFKARGAIASLMLREGAERGVVAASGGNHGAAVAYAAMQLGYPAHIFVPEISSPAKIARIRAYGAQIVIGGARYADAFAASREFAEARGLMQVHAYDDPLTLAGQGTVGLEWLEQAADLDTLIVAVGGGGLIGGIAAAVGDRVKVVAVEPENAPSLNSAIAAGQQVDVEVSGLAADSLGARRVGRHCFELRDRIAASVLVTDAAIRAAQRTLWDGFRLAVEAGGASALAALTSGQYLAATNERIGVLLCGANTSEVEFAGE
ncbi:threonine/serine dehydratase [Devosia sp.]|uniref:threonine/serine dehydratase n=1 Tax=Devosia sp. TaxID=1871048 RepID=UPI003A8DD6EB